MKKTKIAVLFTIALLLCTLLSGCAGRGGVPDLLTPLENQRQEYAVITQDGRLRLNGAYYKKYPSDLYLQSVDQRIRVCEEDVPLLRREQYGCVARTNEEGTIIEYSPDKTGPRVYYFREDVYTELCARLEPPVPLSVYCFYYELNHKGADIVRGACYLTPEETLALENALSGSPIAKETPAAAANGIYISKSSYDRLQSEEYCNIFYENERCYIVKVGEPNLLYPVEEAHAEVFRKMQLRPYQTENNE